MHTLPRQERRRRLALAFVRSSAITAFLIALYYIAPLDRLTDVPLGVTLVVALIALATFAAFQLRWVMQATHPGLRAVEALAATAPLFLLLFAAVYFLMAEADTNSFSVEMLTRTDSLYFTITVFSTVGFGDISPASEAARVMVMAQMVLDLIVLGLGIRVFVGAVEAGRQATSDEPRAA